MSAIKLKDADMDKMKALNAKNRYGLSSVQMIRLIDEHQKGNDYKCALIEYRLTDINFHHEVGLLIAGRHDELKEEVKLW